MNIEDYIKARPTTAWNTGASYTEHGQRIACVDLPDNRAYFYDIDRGIDGVTTVERTSMYINLKEFVTHAYMYGHYHSGIYHLQQAMGWSYEDADILSKRVVQAAKELK